MKIKRIVYILFSILIFNIFLGEYRLINANSGNYLILPDFSMIEDEENDTYNYGNINNDEEALIFLKHRIMNRKKFTRLILTKEYTSELEKKYSRTSNEIGDVYIRDLIKQINEHNGIPNNGDYIKRAYYLSTVTSVLKNENLEITVRINFYTTRVQEEMVNEEIRKIFSPGGDLYHINNDNVSDYDKITAIYDWIINNFKYDYTFKFHSVYDGLFNDKETVCEGYAVAFYRFCLFVGVDSRVIIGMDNGVSHAWNIVNIGGTYFFIDTTHGSNGDPKYFLYGKEIESFNGKRRRDSEYNSNEFNNKYNISQNNYNFRKIISDEIVYIRHRNRALTLLDSGKAGLNVRWVFDGNTLTISGTGRMYDYDNEESVPWNRYRDYIQNIIIEQNVTYIGKNSFVSSRVKREFANIPKSVEVISANAFFNQREEEVLKSESVKMRDLYSPILVDYYAVNKNMDMPKAQELIKNKFSDSFNEDRLPEGTIINFEEEIDTSIPGKKNLILNIIYPDKSSENIEFNKFYVNETDYNNNPTRMIIIREPYKTRYIKNHEKINLDGLVVALIDGNGNRKNVEYSKFSEYGIGIYKREVDNTQISEGYVFDNPYLYVKKEDISSQLIFIVEEDDNYEESVNIEDSSSSDSQQNEEDSENAAIDENAENNNVDKQDVNESIDKIVETKPNIITNEKIKYSGWKLINGIAKYYVDGQFVKGLNTIGKTTYLFNSNGEKQVGWHVINGKSYYFSPEHGGGMLTGIRKIGKTIYLLTSEGKKYGWHRINGKDYYFSSEHGGGMLTGMRKIGNATYLLTLEGKKYGWHRINNRNCYFSSTNGALMIERYR